MDKTQLLRVVTGIAVGSILGGIMGYFGKCTSGACPLTATPWRGAMYGAVMGALLTLSFKQN